MPKRMSLGGVNTCTGGVDEMASVGAWAAHGGAMLWWWGHGNLRQVQIAWSVHAVWVNWMGTSWGPVRGSGWARDLVSAFAWWLVALESAWQAGVPGRAAGVRITVGGCLCLRVRGPWCQLGGRPGIGCWCYLPSLLSL